METKGTKWGKLVKVNRTYLISAAIFKKAI